MLRRIFRCGLAASILLSANLAMPAHTTEANAASLGPSGLPLPRFVSLKSSRVNLRIGPGRDYAVDWMYVKKGLPLEIIQEYDNWRRVRDQDGTEGWISRALLSGRRTAVVAPWQVGKTSLLALKDKPGETTGRVASVEPGAIGKIISCSGEWCEIDFASSRGWMRQNDLWGVYPGEVVKD